MKSNRYKLEIEVYGQENAIRALAEALSKAYVVGYKAEDYEVQIRAFPCNFSPKRFWKLCNLLEKRFWKNFFVKNKRNRV